MFRSVVCGTFDERPPWRERPLLFRTFFSPQKAVPSYFSRNEPWLNAILMRDHPDERKTTLTRETTCLLDHFFLLQKAVSLYFSRNEPWLNAILVRDHPDERKTTLTRETTSLQDRLFLLQKAVSLYFSRNNLWLNTTWWETTLMKETTSL